QRRGLVHRDRRSPAPVGGRGEAETAADELIAGPEDAGLRLDAFLAARGEASSRAAAQRLIERGGVTVDGLVRPKNHRLHEGARVSVVRAAAPSPPPEPGSFAYEVV